MGSYKDYNVWRLQTGFQVASSERSQPDLREAEFVRRNVGPSSPLRRQFLSRIASSSRNDSTGPTQGFNLQTSLDIGGNYAFGTSYDDHEPEYPNHNVEEYHSQNDKTDFDEITSRLGEYQIYTKPVAATPLRAYVPTLLEFIGDAKGDISTISFPSESNLDSEVDLRAYLIYLPEFVSVTGALKYFDYENSVLKFLILTAYKDIEQIRMRAGIVNGSLVEAVTAELEISTNRLEESMNICYQMQRDNQMLIPARLKLKMTESLNSYMTIAQNIANRPAVLMRRMLEMLTALVMSLWGLEKLFDSYEFSEDDTSSEDRYKNAPLEFVDDLREPLAIWRAMVKFLLLGNELQKFFETVVTPDRIYSPRNMHETRNMPFRQSLSLTSYHASYLTRSPTYQAQTLSLLEAMAQHRRVVQPRASQYVQLVPVNAPSLPPGLFPTGSHLPQYGSEPFRGSEYHTENEFLENNDIYSRVESSGDLEYDAENESGYDLEEGDEDESFESDESWSETEDTPYTNDSNEISESSEDLDSLNGSEHSGETGYSERESAEEEDDEGEEGDADDSNESESSDDSSSTETGRGQRVLTAFSVTTRIDSPTPWRPNPVSPSVYQWESITDLESYIGQEAPIIELDLHDLRPARRLWGMQSPTPLTFPTSNGPEAEIWRSPPQSRTPTPKPRCRKTSRWATLFEELAREREG